MLLTGITSNLTQVISAVGFPIVMCFALFYYIQSEGKANREQISKLTDALNNNTAVTAKLLERLDKDV